MAVTDWKSPSVIDTEAIPAGEDWTNPGYAASSNDQDAVCAVPKNKTSYWLRCSSFGFTTADVPSGATIDGIEVDIECAASVADRIIDSDIRLCDSVGRVGDNGSIAGYFPTGDAYRTHGGASDTWNAGLEDTDVRASTFGAHISVLCDGNAADAYIDHVRIRVYYTASAYRDFSGISALASSTPAADILRFSNFAGVSALASSIPNGDLLRIANFSGAAALVSSIQDPDLLRYLPFSGAAALVTNCPDCDLSVVILKNFSGTSTLVSLTQVADLLKYANYAGTAALATSIGNIALNRFSNWFGTAALVTVCPDCDLSVDLGEPQYYWSMDYFKPFYWGVYFGHPSGLYRDFAGIAAIAISTQDADLLRFANLAGLATLATSTPAAALNRFVNYLGTCGLVTSSLDAALKRYANLAGQVDLVTVSSLPDLLRLLSFYGVANLVTVCPDADLQVSGAPPEEASPYIIIFRRRKRS